MVDWGTFIINGTERVVVTRCSCSPGAYVMEPKDREKQVFIANLMPARGLWLELSRSTRRAASTHRPQQAAGHGATRAMGEVLREKKAVPETWTGTDEEILNLFDDSSTSG